MQIESRQLHLFTPLFHSSATNAPTNDLSAHEKNISSLSALLPTFSTSAKTNFGENSNSPKATVLSAKLKKAIEAVIEIENAVTAEKFLLTSKQKIQHNKYCQQLSNYISRNGAVSKKLLPDVPGFYKETLASIAKFAQKDSVQLPKTSGVSHQPSGLLLPSSELVLNRVDSHPTNKKLQEVLEKVRALGRNIQERPTKSALVSKDENKNKNEDDCPISEQCSESP